MPKKSPERKTRKKTNNESRIFPLLVAGLVCFIIATALGIGSWSIFGSQARQSGVTDRFLSKIGIKRTTTNNPETLPDKSESSTKKKIDETTGNRGKSQETETGTIERKKNREIAETSQKFEGVVLVEGGEFAVGGSKTKRPLQRVFLEDFLIAETEVTNSHYAKFVSEKKYKQPKGWEKSKHPKNAGNYPVVNVSWDDANAFCRWLSGKYDFEVRLPSQAEWELAARGPKRFLYPWGNTWNKDGVRSKKASKPKPVKSFEVNKSPFGAYDMLGNVWEWTSEEVEIEEVEKKAKKKVNTKLTKGYLALGGSFIEDRKKLSNTYWAELPSDRRDKSLGFRYVIILNQSSKN